MKTYLFSYPYERSEWVIEIKALNEQDARARVKALTFARYDGELVMKIGIPETFRALLTRVLKKWGRQPR